MIQTNDFIISGFVSQPDGLTPVTGDVRVIVKNDGFNSNGGNPFATTTAVTNGQFSTTFAGVLPSPLFRAATGDTIRLEFEDANTNAPFHVNINGQISEFISRKLTNTDISARNNNPLAPQGDIQFVITLAESSKIRSHDVEIRGDILQSDGSTPPPTGLEIYVENLNKITNFLIPVAGQGNFTGNAVSSLGFDSGDQVRISVRNSLSGDTLDINVGGIARRFAVRILRDEDLVALGTNPNRGLIIEGLKLDKNFLGLLLPPSVVTVLPGDGQVLVSWSNVLNPDAVGFVVQRSITPTGPFFPISGTLVENQMTDMSVVNGIPYYYSVKTILTGSRESGPSVVRQATPNVGDTNFSIRQLLANRFVAGRQLHFVASVARIAGQPQDLRFIIKYRSFAGQIISFIVSNPAIASANSFETVEANVQVPADAQEFVDFRLVQNPFSDFTVDNITLRLTGDTVDATARKLIAPAYSADTKKIVAKNKLPGELIVIDILTGIATLLDAAGNGSNADVNATDDPVDWAENDQTIVFSYFTGLDNNGNVQSQLRRFEFNQNPCFEGGSEFIPDTIDGFFPRVVDVPTSCNNEKSVVYLLKAPSGARGIKRIGLRNDLMSEFVPVAAPINAGDAESLDVDATGNLLFGTSAAILSNDLTGGANKTITEIHSDWVRWASTNGIRRVGYLPVENGTAQTDLYSLPVSTTSDSKRGTRSEFVLDTKTFPDGLLDVRIRSRDRAVPNPNETVTNLNVVISNSADVRAMMITALTDPGTVQDKSTVTAPGAITGGLTNHCALLRAGASSANRGRLEFFTRDTNLLMTTVEDIFTDNPVVQIRRAALLQPAPLKIRFTWLTDIIPSEPGGAIGPCILTVDTGGIVRNIFIPQIDESKVNPLILYISEDGSTYFDPQLKTIARKATSDPLLTVAPVLNALPKFTHTAGVTVIWATEPGQPANNIAHYILLRSTNANSGYAPIYSTPDNLTLQFTDPDIVNGATYFYRLQAIDVLGNVIDGQNTVFTIVDTTGALEKIGFIQVDLSIDDVFVNKDAILEPGTGKLFSPRTTFSLNPERNAKSPPLTSASKLYADYTFQKARDIKLNNQPVLQINSVVGEISGPFFANVEYLFIKDTNVQSGSVRSVDKIRFIKQERQQVEEELVRGDNFHGADGLERLFATTIDAVSIPIKITEEPAIPVAGFLFQLTNTEPGHKIGGKTQIILEVFEVKNKTKSITYQVNDIRPNYISNPAYLQLDIFTNMGRFPFPDPTDEILITYSYLRIFPDTAYELDRSQNAIRWLGVDPAQPQTDQRYLVTYHHIAPVPGERLTIDYTTNNLIRTLQSGNIRTGVRGLDEKRHICADVLARETTPVPIEVEMIVRLFDTADEGFVLNEVSSAVGGLFSNKILGEGIRISDIACTVKDLPDVESVKLDPFQKLGRTDTPYFMRIFTEDTVNFKVKPGRVQGEVTFFTHIKPMADVVIPANTIVSNDFNFVNQVFLFEVMNTFRAPLAVIDNFYNPQKDRYEFRVQIRALFENSVVMNRLTINTIGGQLRTSLNVENETIIEGAVSRQEVNTGTGTLRLTPNNGQLMEVLAVQNYSAENVESIPLGANFIKLKKTFITNNRGDKLGTNADTSVIIDDPIVFRIEVAAAPAQPGEYFVNYRDGFIQTYTKTSSVDKGQQIRYRYQENYDLSFVQISDDKTYFTLSGAANAGRPVPQFGDYILIDYRWKGDGVPHTYRLETFSHSNGQIDLSALKADSFLGSIFINGTEKIDNIKLHPELPFYAFDPVSRQLSIVGRPLVGDEELVFRFTSPLGDVDLAMTTYDLQTRQSVSRFTFNIDFQTLKINLIEFLEMGGDSVAESPGMIINAGLPVTKEKNVVIQLAAVDAKDMIFSQDSLFRDKTDLDYEPFTTTKLFKLSGTDGQKTIYAKIRFDNEAIQPLILNKTIQLDSNSNGGQFTEIATTEFQYSTAQGLLNLPKSFGQSDININDMQSIQLDSLVVTFDPQKVKRTF